MNDMNQYREKKLVLPVCVMCSSCKCDNLVLINMVKEKKCYVAILLTTTLDDDY